MVGRERRKWVGREGQERDGGRSTANKPSWSGRGGRGGKGGRKRRKSRGRGGAGIGRSQGRGGERKDRRRLQLWSLSS